MIAALYVETNGCYYGLPGVDPWDIHRDARFYPGPHAVVAHPPCERWGRFSAVGGLMTGMDGGTFAAALKSIETYGGVLEHPASSKAWPFFDMDRPSRFGWTRSRLGWVCQVEQGHYGHVARKATWLYMVGARPPELVWGPSDQRLPAKRLAEKGYESARRCGMVANQSSKQRQRTPLPFRDLLLSIARQA